MTTQGEKLAYLKSKRTQTKAGAGEPYEDDSNSTYCEQCGCRITAGRCKHGVMPPARILLVVDKDSNFTHKGGTKTGAGEPVAQMSEQTCEHCRPLPMSKTVRLCAKHAVSPELACMLARLMDEVCMTEACMSHIAPLTLEQARAAIARAEKGAQS